MGGTAECPMCKTRGITLTVHHVIEAPMKHWSEFGKAPTIELCSDCHKKHEKYRNYLRDISKIDIDRKNDNS